MSSGPRAASIPIRIVALLAGTAEGLLLAFSAANILVATFYLVSRPPITAAPEFFEFLFIVVARFALPLALLTLLLIAFCVYFLVAPANWRGLVRRSSLLLAASLLGYSVLGYPLAIASLQTRINLSLDLVVVVALGVLGVVGFIVLRDRQKVESGTQEASPSDIFAPIEDPQDVPSHGDISNQRRSNKLSLSGRSKRDL